MGLIHCHGAVNSLLRRFSWEELEAGGNFVWSLIIAVIFMGPGGA